MRPVVLDLLHVQVGERIDTAIAAEPSNAALINCSLSAVERRRREHAVAFALVSVGLEGLIPSEATQARARRFVAGEISLAAFVSKGLD
jgi:hypothetical protein